MDYTTSGNGDEAEDLGFGDDQDTERNFKELDDDLNDDGGLKGEADRDLEPDAGEELGDKDDDIREGGRKPAGWDDDDRGNGALRYGDLGDGADDDLQEKDLTDEEPPYGDIFHGGALDDEEAVGGENWDFEDRDRDN
jgi:hypothetical protein